MSDRRVLGYARVSTEDQELDLQIDALERHGIGRHDIFCDKVSGAKSERPGLHQCLSQLRRGDTLVVWRLDRLGRSMTHLVTLVEDLRSREIGFRSLSDGMIDTTTASGELIFNVFAALAQFERRLIAERTKAGLAAARARGEKEAGGRSRRQNRASSLQESSFGTSQSRWTTSARRFGSPGQRSTDG